VSNQEESGGGLGGVDEWMSEEREEGEEQDVDVEG
jgi:hypothetical protein